MIENRISFNKGMQRKFIDKSITKLNLASLKGLIDVGLEVKYSSLKSYHTERRKLPKTLFENICHIAKIRPDKYKVYEFKGYWGQVKGGKISKRINKDKKRNIKL